MRTKPPTEAFALRTAWLVLAGFLCGCSLVGPPPELSWDRVLPAIHDRFPDVPRISTEELAKELENARQAYPVLLDVRTIDEYDVSHLKGAIRVSPNERIGTSFRGFRKDQPIVVYDSVGFRAASFARRLLQAGYIDVKYLEGSIFKWANEGRPLYRGEKQVLVVHPSDSYWGQLLKKEHRSVSLFDLSGPVF
ncbi:putative adenylyltransferase/sulfurtransferase MoeZ [Methylacidimicrobium cyclopophantes]|uniref:Adenylyltransferase/sulfurtransferase MoeZ n=1 Tax=Methylacidimicrobium cyclopophantes TaxID=1041766 RepID=A0A5E6MGF7_9BACT|nr:rhodanese-like domain-containing protein [Methylacidimicrobium cyclopophantes]VVM06953.1 putative adenylyltransferase/sulfurtransferase MoeZ [Methylacidimicrobium cyclopophantes]